MNISLFLAIRIHATINQQHPADSFFERGCTVVPFPSRMQKAKADMKKKREERLAVFRHAADLFRFVDTLYRLFRMML